MLTSGPGKRLMLYLGESDSWRGGSLYMSILETLRASGIAGATVTRGLAGFGAHSRIRTNTIEVLSLDLPIVITVIDTPANIERAVSLVKPMVREGLITLDDVDIIKYSHRELHPLPADRPVAEFMTRQPVTVGPETPVVQVVELLLGKLYRALPVVDARNHVLGIITNADLLEKGGLLARIEVGQRLGPDELRGLLAQVQADKVAGQIMSSPVVTVRADDALGHVVQLMLDRSFKRFPVVDNQDRLIGMISRLDILRAVARLGGRPPEAPPPEARLAEAREAPRTGQTIADIVFPVMPHVYVNDDLVDVLEQMLAHDSRWVVVLDEQGYAAGIITESDVVARVKPEIRPNVLRTIAEKVLGTGPLRGMVTARDLMSEQVLSAPESTGVAEAIALMLQQGRKRLVVVDAGNKPIGIVDRQILLAASLGEE